MKRVLLSFLFLALLGFSGGAKVAARLPNFPGLQPTPAPEEEVVVEIEQALKEAIVDQTQFNLSFLLHDVEAVAIEVSGEQDFAALQLGMYDQETGEPVPSEPGLAFAVQGKDSTWDVVLPADPEWKTLLDAAPEDILPEAVKEYWREVNQPAAPPVPSTPLTGYRLPWAWGTRAYLSQSTAHDQFTPNGTAHYAFDFYISGQMWNVYASKAGRVVRIKEDVPTCFAKTCSQTQDVGNYIVLEDLTTIPKTFQLYLHLAYDSVPDNLTVGSYVSQGQFIGVADNTGQSWGHHLHFMVHANPNSYWGQSVDIVFEDVDINGGRPRRHDGETYFDFDNCWPGDVCITSQDSYISGNLTIDDRTPPAAGITSPVNYSSVTTKTLSLEGWASDDLTGIASAQFLAYYNDSWQTVGEPFTSSALTFDWDLCEAGVPNGPVSIALRVSDKAGNVQDYAAMTHIVKNYDCDTGQIVPPLVEVSQPVTGGFVNAGLKTITAEAAAAGIVQVDLYYHAPDFVTGKWEHMGTDNNGSNGWSVGIDPASLPQSAGAAFWVLARDSSGRAYAAGIWDLTIDAIPPVSSLQHLPPVQDSTAFPLYYHVSDEGTGVAGFDIQQSETDPPSWQDIFDEPDKSLWDSGSGEPANPRWFLGKIGTSYDFRSRAYDLAGNYEAYPDAPEVSTSIPADVCALEGDYYESSNNSRESAPVLRPPEVQTHNFCSPIPGNGGLYDTDWVRLEVTMGEHYTIHVLPTGISTAVSLSLYTPDSDEPFIEASSSSFGSPVSVHFLADQAYYFLKLNHVDGRVAGKGVSYQLSVYESFLVYLPLVFR